MQSTVDVMKNTYGLEYQASLTARIDPDRPKSALNHLVDLKHIDDTKPALF